MIQTLLLSVGPGSMLALLSLGIVLIFRATGTLNFAQGAMATLGAYAYYELHVSQEMSTAVALILAVVITAAVGAIVELVIMRRLADASPLSRLIASLGVLIVIQSGLLLLYGSGFRAVPRMLPEGSVGPEGLSVGTDRIALFAIAVVITVALVFVYKFTWFGKATVAASENRTVATTLGISPNFLFIGNWAMGGALGGFAGVMLAPYTGLSITTLGLLVVPALAAALLGLLRSFQLTLVGAILVTACQSVVTESTTLQGAATLVPFVAIVLILALRGNAIRSRGTQENKLPAVSAAFVRWPLALVGALIVLSGVWFWLPSSWSAGVMSSILVAIVLLSLVVVVGYSGQVSLVQFGLAGVGAYVAARLSSDYGLPFLLCILAALMVGGLVSMLLALPALRMKGESLAVVTLAFAAVLGAMLFSSSQPVIAERPSIFGLDISPILYPERYATLGLLILVFFSVLVSRLRRSRGGRRMLAARSNERAAVSMGIDTKRPKVLAFVLSGMIAAVGGVLIAFKSPAIDLLPFDPMLSVNGTAWGVVGGIGYLSGPLHGSLFAPAGVGTQIAHLFGEGAQSYVPFVGGILLLLMLVTRPDGLASGMSVPAGLRKFLGGEAAQNWQLSPSDGDLRTSSGVDLEVDAITVSFGGVTAVDNVSLRITAGTVHGLIGPNGAGKTTIVDAITGFAKYETGHIKLGDQDLGDISAWDRAHAGIVRTWQHLELFEDMTVGENIAIAMESARSRRGPRHAGSTSATLDGGAARAIRLFGLNEFLTTKVSDLQEGRKRAVSVVRALAMDPKVLVLDEPVAGLDASDAETYSNAVRTISREYGICILLIEHDVDFVMNVCDEITVLDFGKVLMNGTPKAVAKSRVVREAYLGGSYETAEEVGR